MALCFPPAPWADTLWRGHVRSSRPAQAVLAQGQQVNGAFPRLAEDVHAALYLRHAPEVRDDAPAWATALLDTARSLPEWQQLRTRCQANGFTAGVATEIVLHSLVPLLPQDEDNPDPTPDITRRKLRDACRRAAKEVDTAEGALEGLADVCGIHAGDSPGAHETMEDLEALRGAWRALKDNKQLQHIAALAGRLARLGATHKRCAVAPAVGAIKGLTLGGDLDRLLPSEIVGLRSPHRLHRLATLAKITSKRALQYEMHGEEPETRGPVVVCVDESFSMREGGKDAWSKAVALALLQTATQQKRPLTLLGFDTDLTGEDTIHPGSADLDTLTRFLARRCDGGTRFDPPLTRALEIIRTAPSMRKADIVFITDGEADVSPEVAAAVMQARTAESVHLYCLGIGADATLKTLTPIASACYRVTSTRDQDGATVAPLLSLPA